MKKILGGGRGGGGGGGEGAGRLLENVDLGRSFN